MAATFAAFSARVTKAFFAITDVDNAFSSSLKVSVTIVQRVTYSVADYWLSALSAAFIITMHQVFGYGALGLFLLMWAFDLIIANTYVSVWQRTGHDITLGESYRRAADVIYTGSKVAGCFAFLSVIVKACFWDGPEHIVIFFDKELRTCFRKVVALLLLTALQAAIWTPVYVGAYVAFTM